MWVEFGLALSLGLACLAWWRSAAPSRTFYEGEVYGMDGLTHRRWAAAFSIAAAVFAAALIRQPFRVTAEVCLGLVVLAGILYLAGFLRGASGEDE